VEGVYAHNDLTQLEDCEQAIEVAEVEAACKEARESKAKTTSGTRLTKGTLTRRTDKGWG
jgi:hypothetical protein